MFRVLIIENQYQQFADLYDKLKDRYDVYPKIPDEDPEDISNYRKIIDPVRVKLNGRYNGTHVTAANKALTDYINDLNPRLVIIDYILVGHFYALNGISLARFIKDELTDKDRPVLFLSRTEYSDSNVLSTIGKVRAPMQWLCKGYNGKKIFDKAFIEDEVFKVMDKLIGQGSIEKVEPAMAMITLIAKPDKDKYEIFWSKNKRHAIIEKMSYEDAMDIAKLPGEFQGIPPARMGVLLDNIKAIFEKYNTVN